MQTLRRSQLVISIMALIFAPLGFLVSWGMYSGDSVWSETPLFVAAIAVALLEVSAAIATLSRKPQGRALFLCYGVVAIALVIGDGVYVFFEPAPYEAQTGNLAISTMVHAGASLLAVLFHLAFSIASLAWAITVTALAGSWRKRFGEL
jgi:hypothetical protein